MVFCSGISEMWTLSWYGLCYEDQFGGNKMTLPILFLQADSTLFFTTCCYLGFFCNVISSTNRYWTRFGPTFSIHGPYCLLIFCWDQYSDVLVELQGYESSLREESHRSWRKEGKTPNLIQTLRELNPSLWSCCSLLFCVFYSFWKEFVAPWQMDSRMTSASQSDDHRNLGRYAEKG